jgi:hypothetical protein
MNAKSIRRMLGLITLIALAFLGMNTLLSAEITEIWKKALMYLFMGTGMVLLLRWSNPKTFKYLMEL